MLNTQYRTAPSLNRRARRTIGSTKAAKSIPVLRDRALTDLAFRRLTDRLEGFGNVLTQRHREALYCIVGRFTMIATGAVKGRYAYDLPTGAGKTQAVVAWCAAVHEARKPHSVAVCASKVEALCDLKRDLIAAGVPEAKIGLLHSYKVGVGPGLASLPATADNEKRQFLLVTHARLRIGGAIQQFNDYFGKPRSLVIYDESLLTSEHRSVSRLSVEKSLGWFAPEVRANSTPDKLDALAYLTTIWGALEEELARQERGEKASLLSFPPLDGHRLEELAAVLAIERETLPLETLLRISQQPLRLAVSNQSGGGVVQYEIVVPRELDRMAILDASWPIRELERMDKSIQPDPLFNAAIKTYETVTIHHLQHGAGRGAMERSFGEARREDRKISQEVCEVVSAIPPDEGVLIFVFKQRGKLNMAETLRADLKAAGVDVAALLPCGKPRISFLTWGSETTLNGYVHCSNVILAGVVHRSDADLAGAILGQRDDLLGDLQYSDVLEVRRSEVAHSLYQALSRGSCRMTEEGKARPMKAWLIHPELEVRSLIGRVMPGVVWRNWETKSFGVKGGVIETTARKIATFLNGLDPSEVRISTVKLKPKLDVAAVQKRTFTKALAKVSELTGFVWTLQGRSFVRVGQP